jgi:hypothetical protein
MMTAEYRIRHDGTGWGRTPVFDRFTSTSSGALTERARFLADLLNREVRWNLEGEDRGHYVVQSRRIREGVRQ